MSVDTLVKSPPKKNLKAQGTILSIPCSSLTKAILKAKTAVNSSPVLPILECILMKEEEGKLLLIGSDLELIVICPVDMFDAPKGYACVLEYSAYDLISSTKELMIELHNFKSKEDYEYNDVLDVITSNSEYSFPVERAEDFPTMRTLEEPHNIQIEREKLLEILNAVKVACSNDELRPAMTGVKLELRNESIVFVATDAHRLIKHEVMMANPSDIQAEFIIPKKGVVRICDLFKLKLTEENKFVNIKFDGKNICFECDGVKIISRLIDARFPAYEGIIPNLNEMSHTVATIGKGIKTIEAAIKRILKVANKTTNQVILDFGIDNLTIQAQNLDFSTKGKEVIAYEDYRLEGKPIKIAFDGKKLIDSLNSFVGEKPRLYMTSPTRAAVFLTDLEPETERIKEDIFTSLLMPVMMY